MPELPEVETIRLNLHEHLVGDRILKVTLRRADIVCGDPEDFLAAVGGKRVVGTDRRGKAMWLCLEGDIAVAVHLRMSGRLLLVQSSDELPPHTHMLAELSGGRRLIYVDPRRFGRLELLHLGRFDQSVILRNIGPDALSEDLSAQYLQGVAGAHSVGIKQFLLDQSHLAGIGNIYASEILHRVGLHPATPANRVTTEEMQRIIDATREILEAAIGARGTTLGDSQYQTGLGQSGGYQQCLRVYGKAEENCPVPGCDGVIRRSKIAQRSTYFCPVCQARGRGRRAGR